MTAINGLVEVAGALCAEGILPPEVLLDIAAAMQALLDSFLALPMDALGDGFFREEFRMPAEPQVFRDEPAATPPAPVSLNIAVIARQVQEAVERVQERTASVPAMYASFALPEGLPEIPLPDNSLSGQYSRELARASPLATGLPAGSDLPQAPEMGVPPVSPERPAMPGGDRWYTAGRGEDKTYRQPEGSGELKAPMRAPAISQGLEQNIKRSTLVINELENIVRNVVITKNIVEEATGSASIAHELRSATMSAPAQAEPSLLKGPASAGQEHAPAAGRIMVAGSPVAGEKGHPLLPDTVVAEALKPALGMPIAAAETRDNAKRLSDALAHSIAPPEAPGLPVAGSMAEAPPGPVTGTMPSPAENVTKALSALMGTYSNSISAMVSMLPPISRPMAAGAPTVAGGQASAVIDGRPAEMPGRVGVAVQGPVARLLSAASAGDPGAVDFNVGRTVESLLRAGAGFTEQSLLLAIPPGGQTVVSPAEMDFNVGRTVESLLRTGAGFIEQSPVARLINQIVAPAALGDTMAGTGGMQERALTREAWPPNPVVNLSVSLAAAQAVQKAGASVITRFATASPGPGAGIQMPPRADGNIVNVSVPGATVDRELNGNVSKTSSFYNTFNISVTVKGGSEDGDLKELGKKIGRILSDEIRRYGGA